MVLVRGGCVKDLPACATTRGTLDCLGVVPPPRPFEVWGQDPQGREIRQGES